ncbi:MAG: 1-deoxy-D-xylulose-5-phosphate synthase [Lentisphaeria bacterium]|nr:1-deoxy-D-xylulose-5-phosphate synthase [Lentisphaeria bacterium]
MEKILKRIHSPEDLRKLTGKELNLLPAEIRERIIDVVSKNGGHLAPNLGTVELTIALHVVFHAPEDKILWDVSHQAYTHKLLTGREPEFDTLRLHGGISGFTKMDESPYDCFGSGHSGTALSAAMGFEVADYLLKKEDRVVAVVGDGALTNGITFEALNNLRSSCRGLILIVNDNKMSIARSTGAISRILNRIITAKLYNRIKAAAKYILRNLPHGENMIGSIRGLESSLKSLLVPGVFFEEMGIRYIGPVNGHNLAELIRTLRRVKDNDLPVIVHVITEKGRGCKFANEDPELFHGIGKFNPETGELIRSAGAKPTFSAVFGASLEKLTEQDPKLVTVAAAMALGCGIKHDYIRKYRERFFDVGIAEEHAIAFAAGLAANGCHPVAAIYATFSQRALDCLFHDVALQNLPVLLCADRSGLVEDGPTHHGIYDVSFLRAIPNMAILMPANEDELPMMMEAALKRRCPAVIRYPKGNSGRPDGDPAPAPVEWGKAAVVREGADLSFWCAGREIYTAMAAADILEKQHGLHAAVVNVRFLKPFDAALFRQYLDRPVVTLEDHVKQGGLASIAAELAAGNGCPALLAWGWDADEIIPHGSTMKIRQEHGFTPESIADTVAAKVLSLRHP